MKKWQNVKAKTRKEVRKEKRQQKKVNRFNFHNEKSKRKEIYSKGKKEPKNKLKDDEILSSAEHFEDEEIESSDEEMENNEKKSSDTQLEKFLSGEKKKHEEYFNEIKNNRIEQLQSANIQDEEIINKYEKLLKLKKRKRNDATSLSNKFNDGLDYLLELCTDDSIQKMYQAAKEANNYPNSEEESDIKNLFHKKSKKIKPSIDKQKVDTETLLKKAEKLKTFEKKYFGDDEDFFKKYEVDSCDGSDSELDNEQFSGTDEEDDYSVSEEEENTSKSSSDTEEEIEKSADNEESSTIECEMYEDIYGRKRNKNGTVIQEDKTKYIPPHLRNSFKSIDAENIPERREKLNNLRRQLKGSINRLAESNIHRISIDIENIYNSNARNDTNTVLTEVILNALVSNVLANERLVLEHTLLIAILHGNLGSEIGAFFLQVLIEKFATLYTTIDDTDVKTKELDNIVLIICHLFTYHLFKSNIIYEILNRLSEKLTEKGIECILLVLKSIGFILRKDDPVALKEFIMRAQKLLNSEKQNESSRIQYMLNILMAIKNNNVTKIPQHDESLVEHFKKLLKQFLRSGKYITTLALSLNDLLHVEERGKWWLVGSAWTGSDQSCNTNQNESSQAVPDEQRDKIYALARKQRMNTDAKKNIFYILMTAEDFIDAFEKILTLTNDERTITAVILHCCLSEDKYNAYYSILAQKFCEHDRKYLLAFQFAIWDKIKDMKSFSSNQLNNFSRLLIFLIENDNIPLSVLKVIEFTQIDKGTLRFVKQIMFGLLLSREENFFRIFERISSSMKLSSFKDQLKLFLKVFLIKEKIEMKITKEQMKLLKTRIQLSIKLL